ncbi:MAG: hypothetical protein PWP67_245 [Clostridium butyricum]|uniref:hypothetical protein n=1 Tax=Clostridium butyricum TaxID=1492 RepID=UPI0028FD7AA2|nr:hypothetical protein [Clostridium butyricum]MDK2827455.1 hypothetical protein [Clostridium butyricum]MDU0323458.1 hypothetical protein [Clostridium butyricum]
MQMILALFFIVFGGTLLFMKKASIIDMLVSECWDKYREKQRFFDNYIKIMRIVGTIIFLIGLYITGLYLFYFWYGA